MDGWTLLNETDIIEKLPEQFNEWLESKKWTERRDALQALQNEIVKTPRLSTNVNYSDLVTNLRNVLLKDANINVCALAAKCISGLARGLRTKFGPFTSLFVPIIFERFKEKKATLRDPLIECIDAITSTVNLDSLVEDLITSIDKANPNTKLQGCNFIYRAMKKYKQTTAPKKIIKAISPLLVKFTSDSDAEVRDAACLALGSVMRLTGEKIMVSFLGNVQEDKTKMKKINEAMDQTVAEIAEEEAHRLLEEEEENSSAIISNRSSSLKDTDEVITVISETDPWDMLSPVDILPKLPTSFMEGIESKKWQERRDALQSFLCLCNDNPRLCPKASYGECVAMLRKILEKDANINVCALAARCITSLANGLRKKFAMHVNLVIPVIFEKFKEKKPVLRDPLIDCIDAVAATTTLEAIAEDIQAALEKQNPNIKIQTNLFLYRIFKKHNIQTVPKKVLKALAPTVIKHTADSDPEVRDASYAALGAAMKAVGEKPCLALLADIVDDKVKMGKIKDFCDKARQEAGPDVVSVMVQSIHKSNPNLPNSNAGKPVNQNNETPLKPPAPGVGSKQSGLMNFGRKAEDDLKEEDKHVKAPSVNGTLSKEIGESEKKKEELLQLNKEKATRLRDEKNLKLLKWNFDQPTAEHVEQLKNLLSSIAQPALFLLLFHKDFKQHLKAIDLLHSVMVENPEAMLANSDLILKWISLRFFETNPTVLLRALDLGEIIFTHILRYEESFSDAELASFLPYLLLKLGEAKEAVRVPVRSILHLMKEILGANKIFPFVLDALKTKNSRQRSECLQFLEQLIDYAGMAAMANPASSMKQIASCISDRDNNVRNAAINAVVAAWKEEGDRIYQLIGKMSDKERVMLDERIKRSAVVTKNKGIERRNVNALQQNRIRASIGTGLKGGKMRSARSTSRVGSRPASRQSCSREISPAEGKELNKTYTQKSDALIDQSNGPPRRFALDLSGLELDNIYPSVERALNDTKKLEVPEPIEPVVRQRMQQQAFSRRAESVSSITSLESSAGEVDKVVHGIASVSQATASAAISQLQFLFGDTNTFHFVAERVDAVVQALVTQTSLIRSRHLDDVTALNDVNELVRTICHFLSSLVKEPATCSRMSADALKMLIQEFLYLLRDERMVQLKDSQWIFRSLNYLSIRTCDNADATSCFLALCSMLNSALKDPRNKTVELIIKCIYKQSESFLRDVPLDLDVTVKAIHDFLEEFRPKAEENESIKNAIHSMELCIQRLVAGTKAAVVDHVRLIPNPESSEAIIYMQKCVRGLKNKSSQSSLTSSVCGEIPGQVLTSNVEESVQHLMNKIVTDPFGKGIRLLHTYLKVNPEGRKYIDDALKKHDKLKDFVIYHLKRMEHNDRDEPEISLELKNALEFVKEIRNLKNYHPANINASNGLDSINQPLTTIQDNKFASRRSTVNNKTLINEVAPENEGTTVSHRRNIRASDVEALKQHLNKIRQQQ